jgi:hypothetical protein
LAFAAAAVAVVPFVPALGAGGGGGGAGLGAAAAISSRYASGVHPWAEVVVFMHNHHPVIHLSVMQHKKKSI